MADNRKEFGPALSKLNLVLDDLNERRDYISEALKRLPPYATTLGEVVGSGPGFNVNVYGVVASADRRDDVRRRTSSRASCRTASRTTCAG